MIPAATRLRRGTECDQGFTLVEVVVGMTILSIFLAIFSGAMINVFHSVNRTQQSAYAQSEINQAYIKLEREIRFADGVSTPGILPGTSDPVVEFSDSTSGSQVCTQLRLTSGGTLEQRTWVDPPETTAAITPSDTVVLATDLKADTPTAPASANPAVSGPFAMLAATGDASNERLEIALNAADSSQVSGSNARQRHLDATFIALNTTTSTSSATTCSRGRSTPWPAS